MVHQRPALFSAAGNAGILGGIEGRHGRGRLETAMMGTLANTIRLAGLGPWWRTGMGNYDRWQRLARHWRMARGLVRGQPGAVWACAWFWLRYDLNHRLGCLPQVMLDTDTLGERVSEALADARRRRDARRASPPRSGPGHQAAKAAGCITA